MGKKYKFDPWNQDQQNKIRGMRISKGFSTADKLSAALKERGLDMSGYSYLCRENGVTPVTVDEALVFADVFNLSVLEICELFSRWKNAEKRLQTL